MCLYERYEKEEIEVKVEYYWVIYGIRKFTIERFKKLLNNIIQQSSYNTCIKYRRVRGERRQLG